MHTPCSPAFAAWFRLFLIRMSGSGTIGDYIMERAKWELWLAIERKRDT